MDVGKNLLANSIGIAIPVILLNPLDCYRCRFQVSKEPNMQKHFMRILHNEGFFRGLALPGVGLNALSAMISRGIGFGLYPYTKDLIQTLSCTRADNPILMFVTGTLSGGIGYCISKPIWGYRLKKQAALELGKIVCQSAHNGILTLSLRGAMINGGHVLGYDGTKMISRKYSLMQDSPVLHIVASVVSAFLSTLFAMPADNVFTYRMTHNVPSNQSVLRLMVKQYGISALYRGSVSMFVRVCLVYCIYMTMYEQVRRVLGMKYF